MQKYSCLTMVLLSSAVVYTCNGAVVSIGKSASQFGTGVHYPAWHALDISYVETGARTYTAAVSWWEVDLAGDYDVDLIILVAPTFGNWYISMPGAVLKVSTQMTSYQYGAIPSPSSPGKMYTFGAPRIPIRYVRLEKFNSVVSVGHVEVRSRETTEQCSQLKYKTMETIKVASPAMTISAKTAAECGSQCQRHEECFYFSYNRITTDCLFSLDPYAAYDLNSVFYMRDDVQLELDP